MNDKFAQIKASTKKLFDKNKREVEEEQDRYAKLKLAHQAEIERLRTFIAIGVTIKCKARKDRTYLKRPETDMLSLMQEYSKDVVKALGLFSWSYKGKTIDSTERLKSLSSACGPRIFWPEQC
ncbi:hypothetical protein Tdes44962_MAKER04015 [Teratosphaeria destructans]|uniref:Uncharacterized protein n=1 Tax=Teratosphaeria destructans TaxID=418781 RepID=A0A9W7W106_9PEZI|nr:hypothetical protein Tdes44962_MAKER04015 [Teratosphaeria destructans]